MFAVFSLTLVPGTAQDFDGKRVAEALTKKYPAPPAFTMGIPTGQCQRFLGTSRRRRYGRDRGLICRHGQAGKENRCSISPVGQN
jgi:hypothetical protein